ncbi:MAG: hypothetical protein P0107_03095 [Nitrosomonas sp.]|nr:hypothetical protein [Nitrosomonas sp.]
MEYFLLPPATLQIHEPRAYLFSIARGLVVDHWRRRELEQVWLEILAVLPEPETPAPESRLIFLETLVEIDRARFTQTGSTHRLLVAQTDGLTCSQIAKHLGVS